MITRNVKVGETVKTVNGHDAKILCFTHGKMLVKIMSHITFGNDRLMKYNMDGTSPFASNLNGLELVA